MTTVSNHHPKTARGLVLVAALALLLTMLLAPAAVAAGQDDLADVRRATARYHRIDAALAAGYELGYQLGDQRVVTGCIAHPTDGAMGYHYFNRELFDDPSVDPLRPEGLVYAPGPNGQLQLVAVEWVVPKAVWDDAGNVGVPSVLGMDLHILNPALNWYILHAWVWRHNPAGMFQDWNPEIVCP